MPEPKRALKVFLSYASQDKPVVRELSGRLAGEGWIDPWVDEKKLLPGHDWRTKIEEAVETSDVVLICLSSNSVTKEGFVQKELRYAREIAFEKPDETIFLIPLRLDDCTVPRGLRFYQWGDYFGENKGETYGALLESLKLRHEQKLKLEAEEYARREKAEKERLALEEKTRKEAEEKSRLEAEERARQERDERERKAVEAKARKEAEEKARQDAEERARIEKAEKERKTAEIALQEKKKLEAAQKAKREKAEREATERATQEKLKRDTAEKAKRERVERQAAQIATLRETLSKSFVALKSNLLKAIPFLRIVGFAGIAIVLFWIGSWGVPKLAFLLPTTQASLTPTLPSNATVTFALTPISSTKTLKPEPTSTKTMTPVPTPIGGTNGLLLNVVSCDGDCFEVIYLYNLVSHELIRFLNGYQALDVSPDGRRVLLIKPNRNLYILDLAQPENITLLQQNVIEAAWLGDSDWIGFIYAPSRQVYIIHPDGSGLKQVTHSSKVAVTLEPVFNDGIFWGEGTIDSNGARTIEKYKWTKLDGTETEFINFDRVSPSGKFVFTSTYLPDVTIKRNLTDVSTGTTREISLSRPAPDIDLSFSAILPLTDDKWLIERFTIVDDSGSNPRRFWIYSPDGKVLAELPNEYSPVNNSDPPSSYDLLSPDGNWILINNYRLFSITTSEIINLPNLDSLNRISTYFWVEIP